MNSLNNNRAHIVLRRLGAASFVFFLGKGLLWLIAPFVFLWFA